jgi:hypothetical protein
MVANVGNMHIQYGNHTVRISTPTIARTRASGLSIVLTIPLILLIFVIEEYGHLAWSSGSGPGPGACTASCCLRGGAGCRPAWPSHHGCTPRWRCPALEHRVQGLVQPDPIALEGFLEWGGPEASPAWTASTMSSSYTMPPPPPHSSALKLSDTHIINTTTTTTAAESWFLSCSVLCKFRSIGRVSWWIWWCSGGSGHGGRGVLVGSEQSRHRGQPVGERAEAAAEP